MAETFEYAEGDFETNSNTSLNNYDSGLEIDYH
jgi:hypothetical protein